VWRQALTSALVCEALGSAFAVDPGEAFVAGLLHDAGKLLVLGCLEDALSKGNGDSAADVSALLVLIIATVMVIDAVTERIRHRLLGQERQA
jgi:HD-like signal output (HDOD) protein